MKNPHKWKYVHISEIECKKCTDKCDDYIGTDPLTLNTRKFLFLEQTEKRKEQKNKKNKTKTKKTKTNEDQLMTGI